MVLVDKGRLILIICFLLGTATESTSQNLVPNHSFEELNNKGIIYFGGIKPMNDWFSPNKGTPDIFTTNQKKYFPAIQNKFGSQNPNFGNTFSNIGFERGFGYEYLSVKINKELIKDQLYCVGFYLSLTDKSSFVMDGIGVDFSNEKPYVQKNYKYSNSELPLYKYQFYEGKNVILLDTLINETKSWTLCSVYYKAKGGESYITIGNFIPFEHANLYNVKYLRKLKYVKFGYAAYYIDNVSLKEIQDSSECPCYTKPLLAVNDSVTDAVMEEKDSVGHFVLENIYFETDKAILLDSSYKELDAMLEIISTNKSNKIIIAGHTDNQGDEKHNQQLSEARAKAVYSYFIEKGIAASRMEYIGYGSTNPISDNNTEEGRRKNRRVEILIE